MRRGRGVVLLLWAISVAGEEALPVAPVTAAAVAAVATDTEDRAILLARIDALVEGALAKNQVPGISIAVARGGELVYAKGYGLADVENQVPATEHTVYRIGSVTKQFTVATLMLMVEQGKLSLDDPIAKHLPEVSTGGRAITVEQLLNHTSGLRGYTEMPQFWLKARLDLTHQQMIELFTAAPFQFEPGERFQYNNSAYYLAGMLVERLSGKSYAEELQSVLFDPLGLSETHYLHEKTIVPGRAQGYRLLGGELANDDLLSMNLPFSAGSLGSSVLDLVRWQQALLGGRVVSEASYQRMSTPGRLRDGKELPCGLGLFVGALDGHRKVTHGGGINGFRSQLSVYPDDDLIVAVLANSESARPEELDNGIARAVLGLVEPAADVPPAEAAAEATIYRDEWGIPHIYAQDERAGLYASGWAQAEDRLEQILKNYLMGLGEYAAAFGPGRDDEWVRSDLESLTWDHYGTAKRRYDTLNPTLRGHLDAYVQGINDYLRAHRDEVPAWWGEREADVYMPVAFSRQYIWSWPAGQAADDLEAVGLEPSYDVDARASNQIALAPQRTTFGAAALVIDPHLAWFGRQRYWELRLHAGSIHISGFATAGFPYVNLGHNRKIAWAHTTGGPDTADVYELTLDPRNPLRYRFDGGWRELVEREVEVPVAGEAAPRRFTVQLSHHGPIVARAAGKAYAAALAYADEVGYLESKYWFMVAEDYRGAIKALEVRQIMPQNVMVADTAGNIYYQRTGRVPIRPAGYDWSRPVDGSTSATAWRGIHPVEDLISLLNPEQGYMENNNVGPDTMLVGSPLQPNRYLPYLYNEPALHTHQRGTSALAQLDATSRFDQESLKRLAVDDHVYQSERWIAELGRAAEAPGRALGDDAKTMLERLRAWNGRSDAGSNGALLYYAFRHALRETAGEEKAEALAAQIDDYLAPLRSAPGFAAPLPPGRLDDAEDRALLLRALEAGAAWMSRRPKGLDATFGDYFRAGRLDGADDVSWPVGGGTLVDEGIATVRSIGFTAERPDGTRWGERGQTSTEVVLLTTPIQSFTQPPIGQSDRPDSPHYRDQLEKLLSPAQLKPTWFEETELRQGHIRSEERVTYRPRTE